MYELFALPIEVQLNHTWLYIFVFMLSFFCIVIVVLICWQQAAQALAESVLSVARAEAIVAVTNESQSCSTPAGELSVVVHALRDSHSTTASDLATIVETLALDDTSRVNAMTGR